MDGNTRKKVFIETLEKQLYDAAMEIVVINAISVKNRFIIVFYLNLFCLFNTA